MKLMIETNEKNTWIKYLAHLPEPILLSNEEGEILFHNQAMLDLLGIGSEIENVKKEIFSELNRVQPVGSGTNLRNIVKHGAILLDDGEMFEYLKNGKLLSLKVKCVKVTKGGKTMTEYIVTDLTTVQELQKAQAQEKCFKILVATASHDIRSPLNVVNGILEILGSHLTDPFALDQLNIAKVTSKRMEFYLKGLEYLRQIESDKLNIDAALYDPKGTVKEVVTPAKILAKRKELSIVVSISPGVPVQLYSDGDKYKLILHFLLRNAIKYTFTGEIKVELNYDLSSNKLITIVRDTGIGISKEQLPKLFGLFTKLDERDHLNPQGIGLGLYLCKSLAQKLNGTIEIYSVENRGTVVTVTIPQELIMDSKTPIVLEERDEVTTVPMFNLSTSHLMENSYQFQRDCDCNKVLIVDDDPFNIMILSSFLSTLHYKADEASNGEIALQKVMKRSANKCCHGYKLVLMDINMPVMDGIEATKAVINLVKEGKIPKTSVVAVTAAAQLENAAISAQYQQIGFSHICNIFYVSHIIVQKPVSKHDFCKVAERILS